MKTPSQNLTIPCPDCGSAAHSSETKKKSWNITHAAFTCENQKCKCCFYGEIILTKSSLFGMQTFSSGGQAPAATQTDC